MLVYPISVSCFFVIWFVEEDFGFLLSSIEYSRSVLPAVWTEQSKLLISVYQVGKKLYQNIALLTGNMFLFCQAKCINNAAGFFSLFMKSEVLLAFCHDVVKLRVGSLL